MVTRTESLRDFSGIIGQNNMHYEMHGNFDIQRAGKE